MTEPTSQESKRPGAQESGGLLSAASTLLNSRAFSDALAAARGALALSPDSAAGWWLCGMALSGLGKLQEAVEAYERSLKLDDGNLPAAATLAEAYENCGRRDEALALANWILLKERNAPEIRARATAVKKSANARGAKS